MGEKVRVERISRRLSLQDLGTVLCVTPERMAEYETGFAHIGARDLLQLARFFDVQPTVFFQYSSSQFSNALEQAENMPQNSGGELPPASSH